MRSLRLLALLDHLRGCSAPISADTLAVALSVSARTIYRDMVTLQAMGAPVRGEPGIGYQLEPGYFLPPLHLDPDEMDAVMLGMRLIAARGDEALAAAAHRVSAKLGASMEAEKAQAYKRLPLRAVSRRTPTGAASNAHLAPLRTAIRRRSMLEIEYVDLLERRSTRIVRPLGLTLFDAAWLLTAWCESRDAFRNFRIDRLIAARGTGGTFRHERGKRFEDYLETL
ncbi:helix-turn-helix transcriptional regulator [Sphingomonas sanguinis]|jgi:predicted DNA-binding transcriptional regulator YafY|uniref:WYL domain-containing protein n=1 Tax=Sphingomonas sanguinis TaxID=33051 RepID=A0A7Y7QVX9_9SPHN|nr:WYL domain-containing protein [Sphingomonas sanguinis]MBZ6382390.1 WYL domain-containing protein [Sphingomonas sanguinis]NNG50582.1 WYL domain-containing protein [Sphingomonas sanguinis]NNG54660.1 WYL domain-containing protein [Sphingomonas sanguinis]NVP31689.1 WYL domain-containing protein [Sphingomonas sanguinis]